MCRSNIKGDYFEYKELFKNFESKKIESVINSLRQPFADIAKNLDVTTNTQWIVRTYLASKMILASSVMLSSAEYAESKNLRIVKPYLMYYPLLSCARAVVFTNPYQEWSDELITMNHSKTINIIGDIVSRYDKSEGEGGGHSFTRSEGLQSLLWISPAGICGTKVPCFDKFCCSPTSGLSYFANVCTEGKVQQDFMYPQKSQIAENVIDMTAQWGYKNARDYTI